MTDDFDCDVLVVGGGPVGVTLALLVAGEGARVIVAEAAADIYPLPRAAHNDHEIVRVFQQIGVAEPIMATSRSASRYDFLTAGGEILMRFDTGASLGPAGWPASNMIHQPSIEAALRQRLSVTIGAQLRSNWTFETQRATADGVTAYFSTPAGPMTVKARYLVGCDGARSPVRESIGVAFDDLQFDEPWLVIDTLVHDASRLPTANLQVRDPARPTTCVLMGQGRHRWEFMMLPGETAEQVTEDSFIAELLEPWNVAGAVTLERKAVYRFHALVARQWRRGPVLLAGDAAHQMPPFAGQGLWSGVRDAANLAWKLGALLRGEAGDGLLDTYQPEREPNVRGIIDMALLMGRTVCITDPAAAAARDVAMLAQKAAGGGPGGDLSYPPITAGRNLAGSPGAGEYFPQPSVGAAGEMLRLDDVLGSGAWLIGRDAGDAAAVAGLRTVLLTDPEMSPFADALGGWLDRRGAQAVLVRPDRYVFGTGSFGDLTAAWGLETDRYG